MNQQSPQGISRATEADPKRPLWKRLPEPTFAFFITVVLYSVASPLLSVFTTSFLVQQRNSVTEAMVFIGCQLGVIPFGFIFAGHLLRRFSVGSLYAFSSLLIGAATVLTALVSAFAPTLFSAHIGLAAAAVLQGVIAGVYWAVRNLLTVTLTHDKNRDAYFALESASVVFMSVIIPLTFGALIEYRFFIPSLLTQEYSYGILLCLVTSLLALGAWNILRQDFEVPSPTSLRLKGAISPLWRASRTLLFCKGITDGYIALLPVTLTLTYLGNEFTLGIMQSCCGLLCACLVYYLGDLIGTRIQRYTVTKIASLLVVFSGITLASNASQLTVGVFIVSTSIAMALMWNSTNPSVFAALESCRCSESETFSYIVDREMWLNLGRVLTILLMVIVFFYGGGAPRLTLIPLALAPTQVVLIGAARYLHRTTAIKNLAL